MKSLNNIFGREEKAPLSPEYSGEGGYVPQASLGEGRSTTYRLFFGLLLGLLLLGTARSVAQPASGQAITENLEYFLLNNVGSGFQTVTLRNTYTDPVIVCSNVLPSASNNEAVTRIRSVSGNSFQLRIQQPNDSNPGYTTDVYCVVSEEGSYTSPFKYEARKVLSDNTNGQSSPNNWNAGNAENVSAMIAQNYTRAVVLGQVMSYNDNRFSAFWTFDCENRANRPFQSGQSDGICVGKHVGQIGQSRNNETLGFIVGEAGIYSAPATNIAIDYGGDNISGVGNNPPYTYTLDKAYTHGVVTQIAEDGGQGGWGVLYGSSPLGTSLDLAIDEETVAGDQSRRHTTEEVSYWTFQQRPADLSISKADITGGQPAQTGQNFDYELTISNNGPGAATGITVTDNLPSEVTFQSVDNANCTESNGTVTCNLGTLANGANEVITITVRADQEGFTQNTATVSADNDPDTGNNTATETTEIEASGADLSVAKTDSDDPVVAGEIFTYTLQVTNNGSQNATGVTLTDNLPSEVTFRSVNTTQGSCTENNGTVTCTIGDMANGQTEEINIIVEANTIGTASNSASVSGNENDPDTGNNSASETTEINAQGTFQCYPIADGENRLDYIDTSNNNVQQIGPLGVGDVEASAYNSATGVMYGANGGRLGTINLNNGNFSALPNTFGTAGGSDGEITLSDVDGLAYDSETGVMIGVHRRSGTELAFLIDLDTGQHIPDAFGNGVDYIELSNPNNLETLDDIAVIGDFVYGVVNNSSGQNDRLIRINKNTLNTVDIGRITINGTGVNDVEGLGISGTGQLIGVTGSNEAIFSINPNNAEASPISRLPGNDYEAVDCISSSGTRSADLNVDKTVDNAGPDEGDTITFTVTVDNQGPDQATSVQIADQLPSGLTFVSFRASQGNYDSSGSWFVGTLNTGASATLDIEATVNSGTGGSTITNTASVDFLSQDDPNAGNDSDDAVVKVQAQISGVVFEDITGDALDDGDTTLNDGAGDQQGRANVRVLLFRDGGDGLPDGSDDTFVESTTTNTNGEYSFTTGGDTYWLAVDSRSGSLTDGTTWAEQTFAAEGGYCSDGNGGSTAKTSAGPCFGGRRGNQSDNLPASPAGADLADAEHLIEVTLDQPEAADNNFGFSYNVVTDVRDGDDDGAARRTVQGSLRQFIQNANAISGANAMRFVPAVPLNQGSWWSISPGRILPEITGAQTTVDGTAYSLNDGTTVRNTNTGTTGNGGTTVGVGADGVAGTGDEPTLPAYELKELEINGGDIGRIFQIGSNSTTVRRLGMYNVQNNAVITVTGGTGNEIRENLIGLRANGADPGSGLRVSEAIVISGGEADVLENRIAHTLDTGLNVGNNALISGNDFFNISINNTVGDAITTETSSGQSITVRNNRIENVAAYGLESWNAPGPFTFENNTILNTGQGGGVEEGGIRIFGDGSTIRYNIVSGAVGPGIVIIPNTGSGASSVQNRISKNSIYNNGEIGIDLDQTNTSGNPNGDGVTPNNGTTDNTLQNIGIDYPVFTEVTLSGDILHVEGYVGTESQKISATHLIELFEADDDGNNNGEIEAGDGQNVPHGEGRNFLTDFTTSSDGTFNEDISLPTNANISIGDFITATTTNPSNNTSEFSANSEVQEAGINVSGTMFSDADHNGVKHSNELGMEGVTIVLYNPANGSCRSEQTGANGAYLFENVMNGDYQIIEAAGESTPTPGSCPPAEADPAGFVSTTSNTIDITVAGAPVTEQNFGDFNGSRLTGTVFNDNGAGSGTANDGLQNGAESGISESTVRLTDASGNTVHAEIKTGGEGSYTFFIPDALSGNSLRVVETNFDNFVSTGGDAGNTGGSYDRPTDATTFTPASGTEYTDVNFADVPDNSFSTDGQQNTTAGSTVFFPHTFTARTAGEVTFSEDHTANPANDGWKQIIYRDDNCNGEVDNGEQILSDTDAVTVTAGQQVCVVVRASTPGGAPEGSSNTITVKADFNYTNASPALSRNYNRTDLVNVTNASGSGLKITKEVDQAQALPGATLTYTITYTNNSSEPINDLEIVDSTPAYTGFTAASCQEPLPDNLTSCTITDPGAGGEGSVIWTFEGTLAPGSGSTVTYQVTIQN